MQISLNTSNHHWYDNIWAALIFFTRLPFWRIYQPPRECYKTVVEHWPLTGWLTGGVMAGVLYLSSLVFPYTIAVILAMAARIFLTGALHEDGLCDFFDGFGGGGTDRQRILDIMKDSRIGTYGVLGLMFYEGLLFATLLSLPIEIATWTIWVADPYAKMVSGQIIMMLPYARTEEESKAKTVYRKMNIKAGISMAIQGLLPLCIYLYVFRNTVDFQYIVFAPCLLMYFLYLFILKRIKGYTGDCCGALFLLSELAVYLSVSYCCYNSLSL